MSVGPSAYGSGPWHAGRVTTEGLADDDWQAIEQTGRLRRFRTGQVMLREGATDGSVLALCEGRAKVTVLTPGGREVLLAVKGPGELLGEYAALDGRPRAATVTAMEPTVTRVMTAAEFNRLLDDRPRVAVAMLRQLAAQLRQAGRDSVVRDDADVGTRVARRLVDLASRYGEFNGAAIAISLTLTQDDLASWVGATREATNRALGKLRADGCVTTGRQRIVVTDLAALRRWAG